MFQKQGSVQQMGSGQPTPKVPNTGVYTATDFNHNYHGASVQKPIRNVLSSLPDYAVHIQSKFSNVDPDEENDRFA